MRRLLTVILLGVTLAGVTATAATASTPEYSNAVSQFICVSCHEPLELVHSPQALTEQDMLKGLIRRGLNMSQIKAAMVSQYGTAVLAKPPASGFNLTVYILPPAVFVGGLALLIYTLPKWRARSRRAAETPLDRTAPLDPNEAKRLDDELTNFI